MQSVDNLKTELAAVLNEPVAVTAFKSKKSCPFCILVVRDRPIYDDNGKTYAVAHEVTIEHYTETGTENSALTGYLLQNDIPFTYEQTYVEEERFFLSAFYLENEIIEKI